MSNIHSNRHLYRPIQPAVGSDPVSAMRYKEYWPSDALKPYVYCYWELWSEADIHSTLVYRVVSDGCIDLFMNCATSEGFIIAGAANRAACVDITGKDQYFGMRFLPGCFFLFFPTELKDLANKMVLFRDMWGNRQREFEERLFAAQTSLERIDISESYLLKQLVARKGAPDDRFWKTLQRIYQHRGHLSFETNPANVISPRQLRRLFDRYIGIPPKAFARVVRFQNILRAMQHAGRKDWSDLYLDFGYYDQAHFIHEFNDLCGLPPMSADFLK